jgi:hypothetical protein
LKRLRKKKQDHSKKRDAYRKKKANETLENRAAALEKLKKSKKYEKLWKLSKNAI